MKKLNPVEKSKYIDSHYKEYLRSSFKFENDKLQELFEKELREEELFKGPFVALNLPFQKGKCIAGLVKEGVLCHSFLKLGDIDFNRPLYKHQEEAIQKITRGRSVVVTTGTGSGKTECFLYPIINDILADIENGKRAVGIRSIFLYPMNALVNDQIDRVRKILVDFPYITYGFFTGDTKEKVSQDYRRKYGEENGVVIPSNELVSREEMRKNPPDLLFTNYSMLEYLMIRPNDHTIFLPERLHDWKYVVLDEAHTYYGSLGIELSMLMRRLTALTDNKPNFILTSATLGEQGKSEKDIVEFATNLTSAKFTEDDIIFSKRALRIKECEYAISGKDYILMKECQSDKIVISEICSRYNVKEESETSASIFELLSRDIHVRQLFDILKSEAKPFALIKETICDLVDTEIMALIDVINFAEKDGNSLFDLKYHSFVRPLNGAFVTFGDEPVLSLKETGSINGLKAFEIGNCRYCNTPYIIGRITENEIDGLDYLYQNREVDIYENYGEQKSTQIDYFLMQNDINEDSISNTTLEEYVLCIKCGCIYKAGNINNTKSCRCGTNYKKIVYKVQQTSNKGTPAIYNNIHNCACCGHRSNSGIVKNLSLGKDEGTAIIAQILYEAIEDNAEIKKSVGKLSLKPIPIEGRTESEPKKVKQFLSFSDSRQQASFAAVFLNATHERMLRKRLIWKIIEDQNYREIPVDELAALLTPIIKNNHLFPNDLTAHKNAWVTLLVDLLKVDGAYDGEGLGLYYFDLNLSEIMDQIDEESVIEEFGRYHITKKDLGTIMQVVLGIFKITPAIYSVKSMLTPEEKIEYLEFRGYDNYIQYNIVKADKNIRSFLPIKAGQDNKIVRYIQKVCQCERADAYEILNVIFNNLAVEGNLLKKHDSINAYQIDASKFVLKNYKKSKYYRCKKCGRLTPYNVHNICVQDKCDGFLEEIDPDKVLDSNYYRKQYKEKKIESIVIKEHTAQLDRETAKMYQKEFKNGRINILSCSTTFEMGIDIGGLETVYMRNVPPTPANYVQRAGRAGRRKDSSAYILTYCGIGSHDYTYYKTPQKMISGIIKPPCFNVLNKKIIIRHLMACCLGFFFRKNPSYFESVKRFIFEGGCDAFKLYMKTQPKDLNQYINDGVLPEDVYKGFHDFNWFHEMDDKDEKLESFITTIKQMEKEYNEAIKLSLREGRYKDADYYKIQIENLYKMKLIDSLSTYCVIPKYGFPVDLVNLQIYNRGIPDNRYDLTRDLKIAISEYAPGSEVIVDGNKYTSNYITLRKSSKLPKTYFYICPNCHKVNISLSKNSLKKCKYCDHRFETTNHDFYIEPIEGFKTGITKKSTHLKPKRTYAGEVFYIGEGEPYDQKVNVNGIISVETSSNDKLLVLNRSTFYMCQTCGYSEITNGKECIPYKIAKHKNYRQYACEADRLERIRLGHSFKTDVARLVIPSITCTDVEGYHKALSFLYAFLEGISNALGIERNDIDGIIEINFTLDSFDILIYDNVPGGAGHVKRLMGKEAIVASLHAALDTVSQNCCDENTSCYQCLRNYYNQFFHSKLRRIYAKEILNDLLKQID